MVREVKQTAKSSVSLQLRARGLKYLQNESQRQKLLCKVDKEDFQ